MEWNGKVTAHRAGEGAEALRYSELWRLVRLGRLVERMSREAPEVLELIAHVHDHKGALSVLWRTAAPADWDRIAVQRCWGDLDPGSPVLHEAASVAAQGANGARNQEAGA